MRTRDTAQEDYILRMIRQAGEALRRLRQRLLGGEVSAEVIRQDAQFAMGVLLGAQLPILDRLDPLSAARLVGHPDYVALWTALMDVEADALAATGDTEAASRRHARAALLREAARAIGGEPSTARPSGNPLTG